MSDNTSGTSKKGRFNCCLKALSVIITVFSFLVAITAFIFFVIVVSSSIHNNKCDSKIGWTITYIAIILYCSSVYLKIKGFIKDQYQSVWHKLVESGSVLCPSVKYHLFRLSGKFRGDFRKIFKRDAICNLLILLAGIFSEIAASQCKREK